MASMHPRPSLTKHCSVKTKNDYLVTVTTIPGAAAWAALFIASTPGTLSSEDLELLAVRDGDE